MAKKIPWWKKALGVASVVSDLVPGSSAVKATLKGVNKIVNKKKRKKKDKEDD